ncbi:MAG: transketolase [Alphaproteobacteria bacterium]|nr:transketolase [Alphaproteobacteria bacterium]
MTDAAPPLPPPANPKLRRLANALRALSMDGVEKAKSGHPGMPMGMADVAAVLFHEFMRFDPKAPDWPDRDRFVLSAGHGSMLIYSLLHLTGYPDMTLDELKHFRQLGSKTAGHPERGLATGIEVTTGPLGQGISNSVGVALAERILAAQFGSDVMDHYTYVIAGDGCLMEGISHEAIGLAGNLKLNKLIVFWDNNSITIDGSTSLSTRDNQPQRFAAQGWAVQEIDGQDSDQIIAAIKKAHQSDKPNLIACKTTIAFGAPTKAGTAGAHGAPLGAEELKGAKERLGWEFGPFEVPDDIRAEWLEPGKKGAALRAEWEKRLDGIGAEKKAELLRRFRGDLPADFDEQVNKIIANFRTTNAKLATRQSSGAVLDALVPAVPELLGGSADLTPSNNTRAKGMVDIKPGEFAGRYVHYGVREHGMAAAMNGLAAHGGLIPYGGTFMCFTDYCRPSIRLSGLMDLRVVYIMTHDSIGLGEDGPTHQPVEHMAALRAMINVLVFRPGDAVETAECWAIALKDKTAPSIMALTRQALPLMRNEAGTENKSAKGAYVLVEAQGERQVTLMASGSEVAIAMDALNLLKQAGVRAALVSMPCWELFEKQPESYRKSVLGTAPRVGVEAALSFGWDRWLGDKSKFVGMTGFGASGPIEDLYPHFGITAEKVAEAARSLIS